MANTSYLSFRQIRNLVTLLISLVIGVVLFRLNLMHKQWEELSVDVVKQANLLGAELPPGGVGVINISQCNADELILLPAYCEREELVACLPDHPVPLLNDLLKYSHDDHIAPALVWLAGRRIISVNRANFSIGVNITLKSWKLTGPREIKVIKETASLNGFLSIEFIGDN